MDGTPLQIGKREFVIPEATLEVAEDTLALLGKLSAAQNDADVFGVVAEVVRICLAENYPDLTIKDVKKAMPLRRCIAVMNEVLSAAGFERPAGEAVRP